ncbi:MAG: branched-chain amino acid ABC transporter permease [Candidatus Roseilinea sp.]|nr:MAG: branched-chain amino acid ABC transporter permease [Candidatus Roseilinea sp.]
MRIQPVLDKITPPNVAAWYGVPTLAVARGQLAAFDFLRPALVVLLGSLAGGAVAIALHRAATRTPNERISAQTRWIAIALPFALLLAVIVLGQPGVTIGGANRGTIRLLLAMLAVAAGLFAVRAATPGKERTAVSFALLAGLAALPFVLDQFQNAVMGIVFIFVMMGLGLNIVVGYAGLLDLGYVAFFAIGAYAYAFLSAPFSSPWFSQQLSALGLPTDQPLLSFWQSIPIVMILAAIGGVLLGTPVLRLRGDYLAIVTLGFGEIIRLFMLNLADLTNGPRGLLNLAPPTLFGYNLGNPRDIFILALLGTAVIAFVAFRLERSRIGRAWVAIREDEDAAQAMGVDLVRAKLMAFAIGATFAGVAGQLYAARQVNIFPDNFSLFVSIDALALIIVGGMGSIPGVVLGAIALKGLPEVLRGVDEYRIVLFAALLVVMMITRPEGLLPSERRRMELHGEVDAAAEQAS